MQSCQARIASRLLSNSSFGTNDRVTWCRLQTKYLTSMLVNCQNPMNSNTPIREISYRLRWWSKKQSAGGNECPWAKMEDLKSYFQGSCNNLIFNIMLTNSHLAIIDLLGGKNTHKTNVALYSKYVRGIVPKKKKNMCQRHLPPRDKKNQ